MKLNISNGKNRMKNVTFNIGFMLFRYALLVSIGYIVIFPIISCLSTAVKADEAFFDTSVFWLPKYTTFQTFETAFKVMDYGKAFMRTVSLQLVSAATEVVMCAIVAYGFARFDFKFKKLFNVFLMITIIVPVNVYMVSMLVNFRNLDILGIFGLLNKLTGIDIRPNILNTNLTFYLPSLFAMGLRSGILIYIYIQFMSGLPKELEEAASIDGAGPLQTFWKIVVPSSSVVILTVSVFSAIWHWNDSYLSLMYISDNYPLSVSLAKLGDQLVLNNPFTGAAQSNMINATEMAGCLLFIAPLLIGYLCIQNKFVKSIDRVGITG